MAGGRPRKYNNNEVQEIINKLIDFIDNDQFPTVAKFCIQNNVSRDAVNDYPEFHTLIKKLHDKSEAYLQQKLIDNKGNAASHMFLLKAMHQYRDNSQLTVSGDKEAPIKVEIQGLSNDDLQKAINDRARRNKQRNTAKRKK